MTAINPPTMYSSVNGIPTKSYTAMNPPTIPDGSPDGGPFWATSMTGKISPIPIPSKIAVTNPKTTISETSFGSYDAMIRSAWNFSRKVMSDSDITGSFPDTLRSVLDPAVG